MINYQDNKMVNTRRYKPPVYQKGYGRYKPPVYQKGYGGYKPPVYQRGRGVGSKLLNLGKRIFRFGKQKIAPILISKSRQLAPVLINKAKKELVNRAMKRSPTIGNVLKNEVFSSSYQNKPRSRRRRIRKRRRIR